MNNDDDRISPRPSGDHALEARIVAWVMGEASEFEIAELTRLIAEKPALAEFKARIENTHGLLREAAGPDKNPLRLSEERRAKLLAALGVREGLTAGDESLHQVRFEKPESADAAAEAKVAGSGGPAAGPKRNLIGRSSVLTYPLPRREGPSAWFRGLSIACSLMLTFLILHVTVFAPKPELAMERTRGLRESADRKSALEFKAREANTRAERRKKSRAERAAKEPISVQLPSADTAGKVGSSGFVSATNEPAAAAPVNNEPIPLEPFAIKDDADLGYSATSTLAGTRLNPAPPITLGKNTIIFGWGSPSGISNAPTPSDDLQSAANGQSDSWGGVYHLSSEQRAPTPSDDQIVLSPFETSNGENADSSGGLSTLAGTRVRTDLKDQASAISTVTKDFLRAADVAPAAKPASSTTPESTAEQSAQTQPVSTFSLHVSDVSFRLAADALAAGEKPDPAAIRPEEFYNAFDYGDPAPGKGEAVSCRIEQTAHPIKQQRNLLRIAMRVPSTGRAATQPLHLTILLDTSGSMQRRDRTASVHDAMASLVSLLKPEDQITLIGFARTPHLLAESVSGKDAKRLISLVKKTPAEGGTDLDAALTLSGELAQRHHSPEALNRIVLITDGAANLGDADPKELSTKIEALRQKGIAFDACGVGTSGLDDAMLESLTRHGDGRYLLLDRASANAEFAKQLAGAFRPAAKNVKVQVRFNPNRVAHYRLLGFAQHRLKEEDFRNDKVDAAELSADEAANALYEIEPLPQGEGALGEVFVRFQDAATGQMVERSWTLPYEPKTSPFDRASPSIQLAGTAALIAQDLQGEPVNLDELVGAVNQLRDRYRDEARVQTLINMFDQLRRIDRRP
jgi:Mg-chelatase subunit ChlD